MHCFGEAIAAVMESTVTVLIREGRLSMCSIVLKKPLLR